MKIWSTQFNPDRNFDLHKIPPRFRYVIASTPRSGSHFLGQLMASTHVLGDPLEYFNRANRQLWAALASEAGEDVQAYVECRRTSPNGCFGMKLHFHHLADALDEFGADRFFRTHRFVVIRRQDVLAQAISCSIARQTGSWISAAERRREPVYNAADITDRLIDILFQESQWRSVALLQDLERIEVVYEDIVRDAQAALIEITNFVTQGDARFDGELRVGTQRQAERINEAWRDRYIDEMQASSASWATAHEKILDGRLVRQAAGSRRTWTLLSSIEHVRRQLLRG